MNPDGTPPSLLAGWVVSLVEDSFSIGEFAIALFFAPYNFGTKEKKVAVLKLFWTSDPLDMAVSETRSFTDRISRRAA